MSILPKAAKRSLRIVALPLVTASRAPGRPSTDPGHLTYYHFVTPTPGEDKPNGWTQWGVNKASELWAGFGKAPEGHWKRRTFLYGERLVDRIDFEELALKSLDPSLGPKLTRFGDGENSIKPEEHAPIPLIYPRTQCALPLDHIRTLVQKRTPRHKRGIYTWLLISPLTAPFMIIPIIPNLPFFFCIWRAYSHWKAYKSSSYLGQLLDKGAIVPEPSEELDAVYKKHATSDSSKESSERQLLLTKEAVPDLMALFDLKPDSSFAADVYRALEQARLRLEQAQPKAEK